MWLAQRSRQPQESQGVFPKPPFFFQSESTSYRGYIWQLRNLEDGRPWFHAFQTPICTFGQAEVDAVTVAVREWTRLPYGRRDNAVI